jgi:hypothetical protein
VIGKDGQEKVKDFLLRWWVRFEDVHWSNFGREEGLFAGRLLERWFGRKLWSLRRIVSAFILFGVFVSITYISIKTRSFPQDRNVYWLTSADSLEFIFPPGTMTVKFEWISVRLYIITTYFIYLLAFSISVSLTRLLTFQIAYFCGNNGLRNLSLYTIMLVINFVILVFWYPFAEINRAIISTSAVLNPLRPTSLENFIGSANKIDTFSLHCLSLFPAIVRLVLSIVFVGSFLLKPLLMRPVSLLWARILESEKPVFTLTFGGAAAFATAISEAAKHLWG